MIKVFIGLLLLLAFSIARQLGKQRRKAVVLGTALQIQIVDCHGAAWISCANGRLILTRGRLFVSASSLPFWPSGFQCGGIRYRTNRFNPRPDANQRAMQIRGRGNTYEHQFSEPLPVIKARPGGYILLGGKYHVPRLPWGALGMIHG